MISNCPNPQPDCKYAEVGCFADTDHFYWPAKDYRTKVEQAYRELPPHKEQKCRRLHDERHATERPPTKPSHDEMVRAITSYAMREAQIDGQDSLERQ